MREGWGPVKSKGKIESEGKDRHVRSEGRVSSQKVDEHSGWVRMMNTQATFCQRQRPGVRRQILWQTPA